VTERQSEKPGFEQGPTHPAVIVSWDDAKAFCAWLTEKEQKAGMIGSAQEYRLPTDAEWSVAVGLPHESGRTPREKDDKITNVYPWGDQWPPPKGAGNYSTSLKVDSYEYTSPVGSFEPNKFGLYDMGGNVWQWCEDWYDDSKQWRVLRGASWGKYIPVDLLSSWRLGTTPTSRYGDYGFRCVLAGSSSAR
jgi:formylglycine-generating enzyme required for sulfatase activity